MPYTSVPPGHRQADQEPAEPRRPDLRLVVCGADGGVEPPAGPGTAAAGDPAGAGARGGRGDRREPASGELWRQVDELAGAVRTVERGGLPGTGPQASPAAPFGTPPAWTGAFAALFDDGEPDPEEEAEDALTEALAFSDLYELLVLPGGPEEIRRTGHPEAGTVLEAAARVLPDRHLAREARKAALKARTRVACG